MHVVRAMSAAHGWQFLRTSTWPERKSRVGGILRRRPFCIADYPARMMLRRTPVLRRGASGASRMRRQLFRSSARGTSRRAPNMVVAVDSGIVPHPTGWTRAPRLRLRLRSHRRQRRRGRADATDRLEDHQSMSAAHEYRLNSEWHGTLVAGHRCQHQQRRGRRWHRLERQDPPGSRAQAHGDFSDILNGMTWRPAFQPASPPIRIRQGHQPERGGTACNNQVQSCWTQSSTPGFIAVAITTTRFRQLPAGGAAGQHGGRDGPEAMRELQQLQHQHGHLGAEATRIAAATYRLRNSGKTVAGSPNYAYVEGEFFDARGCRRRRSHARHPALLPAHQSADGADRFALLSAPAPRKGMRRSAFSTLSAMKRHRLGRGRRPCP